ncbi:MAG: pyridoxamine 5'-phosphate oxidase family protein [Streptosporangiales bacterium]|nr:pyridoxamine 5'-phosphate oxidase family protein [Streptosporangiales bacterium]
MRDSAGFEVLGSDECLRLLGSVPVGRVVFTENALPAVHPVNFLVHAGAVIIRSGNDRSITAGVDGAVVAFEVDDIDVDNRTGWNVTAVGRASVVSDSAMIGELSSLPFHPWAPDCACFIRIQIERVTGRRIDEATE